MVLPLAVCKTCGFLFPVYCLHLGLYIYSRILLIKPRSFKISIDSSSLNIFLLSIPNFGQEVKITNILFQYFSHLLQ